MSNFLVYCFLFILGIVFGSFVNVLILRIPLKESVVKGRSHCMKCGHVLSPLDLVPLFSWIFLGGKCRYCKAPISKQYPTVEAATGILFAVTGIVCGPSIRLIAYLPAIICLVAISVIDWRTYEIPLGFNIAILVFGAALTSFENTDRLSHIIGMLIVSIPLAIIYYASKGKALGGGDVKLMFAAGLLLGWKLTIVAFIAGLLYACVIHLIRMKIQGQGSRLALGPYLSAGIVTAMWFGDALIRWYSSLF